MNKRINFTFNGEIITCDEGQSIAAAMISRGETVLRKTRIHGDERSIFCGIGICFDCVVTVNGVINQRSCLIEALEGMNVESSR